MKLIDRAILYLIKKLHTEPEKTVDERMFLFYQFQLSEVIKKHVRSNLIINPEYDGVVHKIGNESAKYFLDNWYTKILPDLSSEEYIRRLHNAYEKKNST